MIITMMENDKGRTVKNQFIIHDDTAVYFQSYNSLIVKKTNSDVFLDVNFWDYSKTTGKYRNIFLGETKSETEKKIKSGEYQLINLNE